MSGSARSQAVRRYPALSYLAGAAALALLLPSGLTLPQSGPSTLAELAPVPGQGQGQGDLSELASAGSNGLGSGAGAGGDGATTTTVLDDEDGSNGESGRLVRRPGSKNCVGNPPRQTEDPLSPPCVAFFEGDNGGATAKGVAANRVVAVISVDQASTDSAGKRVVDCGEPPNEDDTQDDITCKAFMQFFNDRYQTYGRVVHLYANHGLTVAELNERLSPFAIASTSPSDAGRYGIVTSGYQGAPRGLYTRYAPYANSFRADFEDSTRMVATYVCSKLAARPARLAGDPGLQATMRRFGLWTESGRSPYVDMLVKHLDDICGITFDEETTAEGIDDPSAAVRLRTNGVTTVLVPVGNGSLPAITGYATQAAWFPEWVVPGVPALRGIDVAFSARLARPEQWRNAFGVTFDYRRDRVEEQSWYRAFKEGCADCRVPTTASGSGAPQHYDVLAMLFYGIQAAGPRLTAENLDRGMHAIAPRGSVDPYKPAAYFGPGNYSYLKDAMAIWWDASATGPGSSSAGCYKLPNQGRRFRAGEWHAGDADVKADGPCQGEATAG